MQKVKSPCFFLLVAFGILSVAYAIKLSFIEGLWPGIMLYVFCTLLCAGLLKSKNNAVNHIDLSLVLIAFFTASVVNGSLTNIAWIVALICMLYLLIEVINNKKGKQC